MCDDYDDTCLKRRSDLSFIPAHCLAAGEGENVISDMHVQNNKYGNN